MLPLKYAYLVGSLVFLVFWILLYIHRKDLRREMWVTSITVAIVSVATAHYWWTVDWWRPQTITGTRVGIEDFVTGFTAGGVAAVIYEEVFRKRHIRNRKLRRHHPGVFTMLLLLSNTTAFSFWGTGLTSFSASAVSMIIVTSLMLYYRRDLINSGFISGILMALVSLPAYWVVIFLSPGWVNATYLFKNLSGILVAGVPVEELIFWFLTGFLIGPFYEYWQGERLRSMTKRHS